MNSAVVSKWKPQDFTEMALQSNIVTKLEKSKEAQTHTMRDFLSRLDIAQKV